MGPAPVNIADFERLAAKRLDPGVHGYFAGGAGDERTLRRNREAFERWELRPRVLVDVSEVDPRIELLGIELAQPFLVAPVAFQRMAHPDGEPGMARAAAEMGVGFTLSNLATSRPSEIAAAAPDARKLIQLYCFRDRGVTRALLEEAVESGFEAAMLTVDGPYAGKRERDLRTGFQLPAEVRTPAIEAAAGKRDLTVAEVFALVDPSLDWAGFEELAAASELPLMVKGLVRPEDAERAVEHGAAAVVVSNHGGRQLDGEVATIDALPDVADAVGGRLPVLMDGGIRRGGEIATALSLGADAVLVGRGPLWGLAVDGEDGARRSLEILAEELRLALALLGCPRASELDRSYAHRR